MKGLIKIHKPFKPFKHFRQQSVVGLFVREYNSAFTKLNVKAVCKSIVATQIIDETQASVRRGLKNTHSLLDSSLESLSLLALAYVMMPNHHSLALDHLIVKAIVMKVNKSHNIPSINGSMAKFVRNRLVQYFV